MPQQIAPHCAGPEYIRSGFTTFTSESGTKRTWIVGPTAWQYRASVGPAGARFWADVICYLGMLFDAAQSSATMMINQCAQYI